MTARDVQRLAPFLVLGLVMAAVTVWLERHHVGARGAEWALTPLDRVLLAGRALWFYAGKLLWPHPLLFFYPRWMIDARTAWQYAFPAAALALVGTLWLARARIGRGPLAAVLVFAGVLTPPSASSTSIRSATRSSPITSSTTRALRCSARRWPA